MKLSIIIPAHNEEKRISPTLESYTEYFDALQKSKKLAYEIIVVINATTDKTLSLVRRAMKKHHEIHYLNLKKGGKGNAVIEGFKQALKNKSDLIGFLDADGATPPQAFDYLIQSLGECDGVIASRYLPESLVNPKPSFRRIFASRLYNLLIRALFLMPYHDTQCGAKVFRREALAATIKQFTMAAYAFDVDVLYHLHKQHYLIKEVPTIWSDKEYSKINFIKAGPRMALGIVRLRIANSPFKLLLPMYDALITRRFAE